jgi:tRNA A37 methylthiotransferase MiaB
MHRSYSVGDFKAIIAAFRKEFPELTFSTDVICGFPGESMEAFESTLKLIEEVDTLEMRNSINSASVQRWRITSITEGIIL